VATLTFEFDALMSIHEIAERDPKLKPIAEWLADICIAEASGKVKGWSFEEWKTSKWGRVQLAVHGDEELKWEFLDECHDVLDHHGGFHHKVFKPSTVFLIEAVYQLFTGKHVSLQNLKKNARQHAAELVKLARKTGAEEDGIHIKLRR
jgi:hypothetical protein